MSSPNVKAKHKAGAPAIGIHTSPRTNHNPYATGSASGQPKGPVRAGHFTYGGSFAKRRGVGSYSGEEYVPPQPARALSFATLQAERAYQSSKEKTHSPNNSGDKRNPAVAKSSWPKKKFKQGEDDDDVSIQDGTDDKDMGFVPITDKAMENIIGKGTSGRDDIDEGMRMRHQEAFTAKAFPEGPRNQSHHNAQVRSGSMKTCRPKSEVDYIIYVITNWEKGTVVNKMTPGLDKDRLVNFHRQKCSGNKYIH
jgi:hypothetical protein